MTRKPISEVTAGELARALKWRMDDHRARDVPVSRMQMEGPHDERVVATAIASLLGSGYDYAEASTAYNAIVSEHVAATAAASVSISDSLTVTALPAPQEGGVSDSETNAGPIPTT